MSEALVLRPAVLQDREALLDLKARVFPGLVPGNEERRFDWEFPRNPARREDQPFGAVVEGADGVIVGAFSYVPHRVWIGGREGYGGAAVDLAVDPAYRGRKLGAKLSATLWSEGHVDFAFGTGTNDASLHLFTRLGATLLGGPAEQTAFAYFIDDAHPPVPEGPRLAVEEVEGFGAEEDELWVRLRARHKLILVRDSTYLNWRYRDYPFGAPRMFRARGPEGSARAVSVVQSDPRHERMFLLDWFSLPGDEEALRGLLVKAVELARESGLKVLYYATRDPRQTALLRAHDFRPIPGDVPTYICKLFEGSRRRGIAVKDWYTALGDGDQLYNAGEPRPDE